MPIYNVQAAGKLEARDDADARARLDGIAKILADGNGELGYDWWLEAGRQLDDTQETEPCSS